MEYIKVQVSRVSVETGSSCKGADVQRVGRTIRRRLNKSSKHFTSRSRSLFSAP